MLYRYEANNLELNEHPHTGFIGMMDFMPDEYFEQFGDCLWSFGGGGGMYPELPAPPYSKMTKEEVDNAVCFFTQEGVDTFGPIIEQARQIYEKAEMKSGIHTQWSCIEVKEIRVSRFPVLYVDRYQIVFQMTDDDLDMVISSQA